MLIGMLVGSPYAIDIITPKKLQYAVKVYGPGIHDGVLPDFESHFLVDARGAGAGELKVVLMGPRGLFYTLTYLNFYFINAFYERMFIINGD